MSCIEFYRGQNADKGKEVSPYFLLKKGMYRVLHHILIYQLFILDLPVLLFLETVLEHIVHILLR